MNKMILYKEWLKTRWPLLGALVVMGAFTFYSLLNLAKVVQFRGADILWSTLVFKDTVLIEQLRYLPALAGALVAVAQFLPEMQRKRLKLTLHLPYPQGKMIALMALYGLCAITLLFWVQALTVALVLGRWVVWELVARILVTSAVWYLAGWAAYLWVAAICLEPTWRMRVVLFLLLAGVVGLLFLSSVPEAYDSFLPWLVLYVICGAVLLFHSVARFKEGLQD